MSFKSNAQPRLNQAQVNGAAFEARHFAASLNYPPFRLERLVTRAKAYSALYAVFKNERLVGYYGVQHSLYRALKLALPNQVTNEHIKHVLSKKIIPDEFLIVLKPRQLIILEKKTQARSGSVVEKLQTAPFKLAMFEKLLSGFAMQISYVYILSAWFQSAAYRNIIEYYESFHNVHVCIEGLSLDWFSLSAYFAHA